MRTTRDSGTFLPTRVERRRIVRTTIERVSSLTPLDRLEMYALMLRYYDGVTREQFERDLTGKQHLIRMFDRERRLCGFSTIQLIPMEYQGRSILTIFSGDTVIDRACWGQKQLQWAFALFLVRCRIRYPLRRIYWFLITKGYKTYMLMRNNFSSWPNHREPTPPEVQAVLDYVANLKFPENYDPERGLLVHPGEISQVVKLEYTEVSGEDLRNPDIRHFVSLNPGYFYGDELCCLAKVSWHELALRTLKYGIWYPLKTLLGLRRRKRSDTASSTPERPPRLKIALESGMGEIHL